MKKVLTKRSCINIIRTHKKKKEYDLLKRIQTLKKKHITATKL